MREVGGARGKTEGALGPCTFGVGAAEPGAGGRP
jgi:hypothetical protein